MKLGSYSFFSECGISYRIFKYFIYGVCLVFFSNKCWKIRKLWIFSPSTGEIPDFWGILSKQLFPQYWGNYCQTLNLTSIQLKSTLTEVGFDMIITLHHPNPPQPTKPHHYPTSSLYLSSEKITRHCKLTPIRQRT